MSFEQLIRGQVEIKKLDLLLQTVTPPDMRAEVKAEVGRLARTTTMPLSEALRVVHERMALTGSPYAK